MQWFTAVGLPKWIGVLSAVLLLLASVTLLMWLIVTQFRNGFEQVAHRATLFWAEFLYWISTGPFGLDAAQVDLWYRDLLDTIKRNQNTLWSGALGVATSTAQFFAGALLTLFALIFMLIDGKRIWYWVLGFLPSRAHAPVDYAARAGWVSVGQYVRVQIFVAFVDAVGIGLGAWILGVPLAVPIGVLVFLGSFIPFLGAITTGVLACFVALVFNGPVNALFMLGVVVLINQLEGHILQPLVMGSAVRVHPLGVVVAVSSGALLAGIPGALFAVPLTASANSIVNTLAKGEWKGHPDPLVDYHYVNDKERKIRQRVKNVARLMRKGRGSSQ